MCNCGNKRETLIESARPLSSTAGSANISKKMWPDVKFKYTGKTALTVYGSITGKKYRFSMPGEIQIVDYRDAAAIAGIHVLQKVN
jgi:hypothetical protein